MIESPCNVGPARASRSCNHDDTILTSSHRSGERFFVGRYSAFGKHGHSGQDERRSDRRIDPDLVSYRK
jgi:hypothetical protein